MLSYRLLSRPICHNRLSFPRRFSRCFSHRAPVCADYLHTVVGGGAVGMAIAAELAKRSPPGSVLVVEKNGAIGQETTSRNSEVIHAGLYYPPQSLKTKLCIEGKELIYREAARNGVEVQKVGKWIVAQNDQEDSYLEHLHLQARELGIPTEFVPLHKARFMEPAIVANRSILSSPTSGILSAHSLTDYLHSVFQAHDGELAVNSEVAGITPLGRRDGVAGTSGYAVQVRDVGTGEEITVSTETLVNAAGLHADKISNMVLPAPRHVAYSYAKGNYFTLTRSHHPVRRLVYPAPLAGLKGLGTHLTVALDGQIKFGPDREIVPEIEYTPNAKNIPAAYEQIVKYYPGIAPSDLVALYAGIRPQLQGSQGTFQDFVIRTEDGLAGFVNLLNIDSPGLTSSMAIGRYVADLLYK